MKVALVYDRVNRIGGAERVLELLHQLWPEAPLYTAVYDPEKAAWAQKYQVVPSFLQHFPWARQHHELYGWLTPAAFENFCFNGYDLVISVASAEAKAVITRPETVHLCYCLTPTRYLWSDAWAHFQEYPYKVPLLAPLVKTAGRWLTTPLRIWDQMAAQRPDYYLAISKVVQTRIKKYYGRESRVVYPPVAIDKFAKHHPINHQLGHQLIDTDYFLIVSRLVPYKKVDLAIRAFNQSGQKLVIVGDGQEKKRLKKMAEKNIIFVGELTEERLIGYYRGCQALVVPQEEDFGLVMVEAQAAGKPVIAYQDGGALEIVIKGKTGRFFAPQTAAGLLSVVREFRPRDYSAEDCRRNAQRFSADRFKREFLSEIEKVMNRFDNGPNQKPKR